MGAIQPELTSNLLCASFLGNGLIRRLIAAQCTANVGGRSVIPCKLEQWESISGRRCFTMRFAPLKSEEQLDLQALHCMGDRLVSRQTGIINQRSSLFERGIMFHQGRPRTIALFRSF